MSPCILCNSNETTTYYLNIKHNFLQCDTCSTVFRDPENRVTAAAEKTRYLTHKNDVNNPGYQLFVQPILQAVQNKYDVDTSGLDFGAGTGPVITKLLSEKGYQLTLYDPFFHPNKSVLEAKYDYIVCCEVIEHFYNPIQEFILLNKLLKPGGTLFCMTDLWNDTLENFAKWYYKNDETHVVFYNEKNLDWIKEKAGFTSLEIKDRLVLLS